jgi:hypothetical protein
MSRYADEPGAHEGIEFDQTSKTCSTARDSSAFAT